MQKSQDYYVGLDIGTSMVRCVVGVVDEVEGSSSMSIIGAGTSPNQGMRKGTVTHPEEVANAITAALDEAERVSGKHIREATILVNGAHVTSQTSKGVVAISGAGRQISDEDRMRVEEAATVIQLPANREIIQVFAKNYRIDGQDNIKDPVGMQGVRLEVDAQIITASTPILKNLDYALERSGVTAHNRVVAGIAASEAILDRNQKESGTAVVDIGAGTTNIAVIEEGEIEHVAVIPVGSQHITNDLAIGLKTDLSIAEKVKCKFGDLSKSSVENITVDDVEIDNSTVQMIIEARVEELLEIIDKEFAKIKKSRKLPGGVVFVGGGSKLPGLAEFAKQKLELPAKIGKVRAVSGLHDVVDTPEYATAVGLMLLDALLSADTNIGQADKSGVIAKLKQLFGR